MDRYDEERRNPYQKAANWILGIILGIIGLFILYVISTFILTL